MNILTQIKDGLIIFLILLCIYVVFHPKKQSDIRTLENKLDSLQAVRDTLIQKETHYKERIKTNEVHFIHVRDSIKLLTDSQLTNATINAINGYLYLSE